MIISVIAMKGKLAVWKNEEFHPEEEEGEEEKEDNKREGEEKEFMYKKIAGQTKARNRLSTAVRERKWSVQGSKRNLMERTQRRNV